MILTGRREKRKTPFPSGLLFVFLIKCCLFLLSGLIFYSSSLAAVNPWTALADGLDRARFSDPQSDTSDSFLTIIRIDPAKWEIRFLSISKTGEEKGMSAQKWCQKYDLAAAINGGLYDQDGRTHVGLLKIDGQLVNRRRNSYKSAAAVKARRPGLPEFRIFDLDVVPLDSVVTDYDNVMQNQRLIKCPGENRWPPGGREWIEAALGEDSLGRALFIYCPKAVSMYDFNELLLSLPIGLVCAQHLEGGVQSQLFLDCNDAQIHIAGGKTVNEADALEMIFEWPLPNIIGIRPKAPSRD